MIDRRTRYPTAIVLLLASGLSRQASAAEVDQRALTALEQMGGYLHGLPYFSLSAETYTDQILESGQIIEFHHRTTAMAVPPDKLHVSVDEGRFARKFFYNGKSFTLYDSRNGYYATSPAPPGIDPLLDQLTDRYGIDLPLADLFRWDKATSKNIGISDAQLIGNEVLGEQICTHYAYRQPGIDWQLWVRQGPRLLPCRLVIVRKDIPEQPRHSVDFTWDLSTRPATSTFDFRPPAKALAVPMRRFEPLPAQPAAPNKPPPPVKP
jgi:hypothetical protein